MAFYSRRGNWGFNPRKRWRSGGAKFKAYGNYKASKQTRDAMNITVKCNKAFISKYHSGTEFGTAVINIYDVLRSNVQFNSFAKLYDQVKLNNVSVTLNVVDATIEATQLASVKTINVVTAWDRTGISGEQVKFYDAGGEEIARANWDMVGAGSFAYKIGKGIVNATGVEKSILNSFQRWTRKPYISASTIEEKGCYISTSNFREFVTLEDYNANNSYLKIGEEHDNTPITELFNSSNPCVPFESPSCKWKPTLLVGVFKTGVTNVGPENHQFTVVDNYQTCGNVIFNAEFSLDVTFRNLKASM